MVWRFGKVFASLLECFQVLHVKLSNLKWNAMMQTRDEKVEKLFIFYSTKLGLLHAAE